MAIKGISKGGKQPLADFVGRFEPEGGLGGLELLKLQLHELKKRRVLSHPDFPDEVRTTRTPIEVSLSAQIASLVLIARN